MDVERDPVGRSLKKSLWRRSLELGLSCASLQKILKKFLQLYPYRIQIKCKLAPDGIEFLVSVINHYHIKWDTLYIYIYIYIYIVLEKAICIFFRATAQRKDVNPSFLLLAMSKIVGQTAFSSLGVSTGLGEGKLNLNLLNSTKNWPILLMWRGWVYIYIYI